MKSPNVSIRRPETLKHGVLRTTESLIKSVAAHLDSRNDEESIHRVRTAIKRLRALLRLIRPAVETAFFDRENERLRITARILSFARDSEVARDTLKTLPVSDQSTQEAVNTALPGLEKRVERTKTHKPNVTKVKQRLNRTRQSFRHLRFRGTDQEIIRAGIRKVYGQGRRRMKAAIETGQESAYHRWRIRAKNLYYELQFLEPVRPKPLRRMVRRLS